MPLIDTVAKFIHKGHQLTAEMMDISVPELYSVTRSATHHQHPRKTVNMSYHVSVGDVYKPEDWDVIPINNTPHIVKPSNWYVIYQLSYPTVELNLVGKNITTRKVPDLKSLILVYEDIDKTIAVEENLQELNLHNISSIICSQSYATIPNLLSLSRLVGNIADRLT